MRRNSDMGFFELEKAKKWVDKLGLEWAMKAIKHHESHLGMTLFEPSEYSRVHK